MSSLVFDIGGTTTRAAIFDPQNATLGRTVTAPTPNHLREPDASFEQLRDQLLSVMARLGAELDSPEAVTSIDLAFAGPLAPNGDVRAAPTVWGERLTSPYPFRDDVARLWPSAQVRILNDVTAAGYRYLRSAHDDLCIVTVSSGIGHKVFVGGRPLLGPNGSGGELGHLCVDDSSDAPLCECGGRGHLCAIGSGRGVLAWARRTSPHLTSGDLAAAFRLGEPWAVEFVAHGAAPLGWALGAMHLGIGIERFVLFGGFALALGERYRRMVAKAAAERCWRTPGDWNARIELGVNDDLSGLIGAGIAGVLQKGTAP